MTQFQPVRPSFDDNEFRRLPEVCKARHLYREQKRALRDLARRMLLSEVGADTQVEAHRLADMLHNIAGTAAHFDERDFGEFAGRLEQSVRSAFTAELLRPLSAKILAALAPQIDP